MLVECPLHWVSTSSSGPREPPDVGTQKNLMYRTLDESVTLCIINRSKSVLSACSSCRIRFLRACHQKPMRLKLKQAARSEHAEEQLHRLPNRERNAEIASRVKSLPNVCYHFLKLLRSATNINRQTCRILTPLIPAHSYRENHPPQWPEQQTSVKSAKTTAKPT